MQHFYNTHIFKSSIESCRDEGIHVDVHVDYVDNVPVIDLISSLRTGLVIKFNWNARHTCKGGGGGSFVFIAKIY